MMTSAYENEVALQMAEVKQLRVQGKHCLDIGDKQLFHAAYRSARVRVRGLRFAKNNGLRAAKIAPCFCARCKQT